MIYANVVLVRLQLQLGLVSVPNPQRLLVLTPARRLDHDYLQCI